jgi:tetratricopeptide (TPR) repeat protein
MLAVLAYLRAFEMGSPPRLGWLVATLLLFLAALLSHAVAVSLPAVLLILDVYPLRRFGEGGGRWFAPTARKIWYEKVPFIVASLVFVLLAIAARRYSLASVERNNLSAGLAHACYGIWFYLRKTVLPLDLIAVYPVPGKIDWLAAPFLQRIVGTLVMSVGFFFLRRRWPGLLMAWLSYLVILAPNLGVIRFSEQIAADRYTYMAMLGWVIVMAGCFCRLSQTSSRARPVAMGMLAVGVGLLVGLIPMTWDQCRTWRNSEALWAHALNHGGAESSSVHYNLALVLYNQGKLDAAADHNAEAIRLNPGDVATHNFMGVVLQRQGKLADAAARYAEALRLKSDYLDAHYNLGIILSRQGKFDEAASHYAQALRLNPGFADAHHNLGVDFSRQGKLAEAEAHYTKALRLNPGRVGTHTNLGVVLSRQGKLEEAAAHYAEALRLDPGYAEARINLEVDLARQKKLYEAAAH